MTAATAAAPALTIGATIQAHLDRCFAVSTESAAAHNAANPEGYQWKSSETMVVRTKTGVKLHLAFSSGGTFCGVRGRGLKVNPAGVTSAAKFCEKCFGEAMIARIVAIAEAL